MRLTKPSLVALIAGLALALAPTGSKAASTANIAVSATVDEACTLEGTPALAFGSYDPSGAAATGSATLSVICTIGTDYTITFDGGDNEAAGVRNMAGPGAELLAYALYTDSGRTTGLAVDGTMIGTGIGRVAGSNDVTVYGEIAAGQYVTPGSYSDTVVATVSF